jgi:hypothetical protein
MGRATRTPSPAAPRSAPAPRDDGGNELPFVRAAWTLAGTMAPESMATDIRLAGSPASQTATFPLDLTVADFP